MLLFFLLTAVLVRVLVPLTEGTWFRASAHAGALVEPAYGERDNNEDQCCCYKIRHAMNSSLIDQVFRLKLKAEVVQVVRLKADASGSSLTFSLSTFSLFTCAVTHAIMLSCLDEALQNLNARGVGPVTRSDRFVSHHTLAVHDIGLG
jgi:hypothetical protein